MNESVLIIGAGSGLNASLARLCGSKNMTVVLAARNITKLDNLKKEMETQKNRIHLRNFMEVFPICWSCI